VQSSLKGFLDESSAHRDQGRQEYLVCAALLCASDCDDIREQLRPLLLPGQVKLHWSAESDRRRRAIIDEIVRLGPMNVVVSHLGVPSKRDERYRRKCLEAVYHEMVTMDVFDLTLESRSSHQDRGDRAHVVALQGQGLDRRLRIGHRRGGDDPLLWIADAVLGAINSAHAGKPRHLEALKETLLVELRTADSELPCADERP